MSSEVVLSKFTENAGMEGSERKFYVVKQPQGLDPFEIPDTINRVCNSCPQRFECIRQLSLSNISIIFSGTKIDNPECQIPKNDKGGLVLKLLN